MRDTKKIIKEISTVTVDKETGEILNSNDYKERKVETEPDFIKIYLDDIAKLSNLPKGCSSVMYHLLRYMTYENVIVLNSFIKKSIATYLETNTQVLDHQIVELTKQGIICRVGRGTYFVNPNLFGKGKWQDIRNMRLTITYDRNGRTFQTERNIPQQTEIPGMETHAPVAGVPPLFQIYAAY